MKLVLFTDVMGYAIEVNGSPVFLQPSEPSGEKWTDAQRLDHAMSIARSIIESSFIEPNKYHLNEAYNTILSTPYVDDVGRKWELTFESVQKMHSAVQLVEAAISLANAPDEVTLYDIENTGHLFTVVQAKQLLLAMGIKLQEYLGRKQAILKMCRSSFNENKITQLMNDAEAFISTGKWTDPEVVDMPDAIEEVTMTHSEYTSPPPTDQNATTQNADGSTASDQTVPPAAV